MSTRILVVEDHPLYAEALLVNLRDALPKALVTHANSLEDARSIVTGSATLDLVLLDLCLPDARSFDALIEMRRICPDTPILVVSAYCDETVVSKGMAFGATGFVSKCATRQVLIDAVKRALTGEALPRCARAAAPPRASAGNRLKGLTTQQLRVLQLVCQGLLNKQIAHHLAVSEATIKAHVGEILHKLGVSTRTQAVAEMSRAGLVQAIAFSHGEPHMPEQR